jgi:hypothetical protein
LGLYLIGMIVVVIMEGDEDAVFGMIGVLVMLAINGVVLYGAVKLKQLENYALCMTAAILMVIPCSPCFFLSVPFGIWALIVLFDARVRDAFT